MLNGLIHVRFLDCMSSMLFKSTLSKTSIVEMAAQSGQKLVEVLDGDNFKPQSQTAATRETINFKKS